MKDIGLNDFLKIIKASDKFTSTFNKHFIKVVHYCLLTWRFHLNIDEDNSLSWD